MRRVEKTELRWKLKVGGTSLLARVCVVVIKRIDETPFGQLFP